MHGEVDAEAPLGPVHELVAERGADIDRGEAPAVAHDRRHAEDAERQAALFDACDLLAAAVRLHHGDAALGGIVAEDLRLVHAIEIDRGRRPDVDQRDALRLQCGHRAAEQRAERVAVAFGDGVGHRRQRGEQRTQGERRAPLIIDRGDDAVVLQLELLFERESCQRTLLDDRKAAENAASRRDGERDREDQAGGDGPKLEHGISELRERERSGKSQMKLKFG